MIERFSDDEELQTPPFEPVSGTHQRAWALKAGKKSFARWAMQTPRYAVVFIHGFASSPYGSFKRFYEVLPSHPVARDYDLIFYGYRGLRTRVMLAADEFERFLHAIATNPGKVMNASVQDTQKREPHIYERIFIVGHSTGAVVSRFALLDAERAKRPWLDKIKMIFFAPAHCGTSVGAGEVKGAMAGDLQLVLIQLAINLGAPIWQDLLRKGPVLKALRKRTSASLARAKTMSSTTNHLIAKRVIFGTLENIVEPIEFLKDPRRDPISERTHTSVCKVKGPYEPPFAYLLHELSNP